VQVVESRGTSQHEIIVNRGRLSQPGCGIRSWKGQQKKPSDYWNNSLTASSLIGETLSGIAYEDQ
jgi:hypothetical protein